MRSVHRLLRVLLLAAAAAGSLVVSSRAPLGQEAAGIRGRVQIGIPIATRRPTTAYPTRSVPSPRLAAASERRNVVVYLRNAQPQRIAPMRVAIRQRDELFTPRVVAVTVGSDVEFPNDDPIYHNVFSLSRAKNFNLGRYPRGETRRVRFDRPGVVKVFCEIHSHMSATVMVFDHPWFTVPNDAGAFELTGLPAGDRQVTAWHERLGDTTVDVRVELGRMLQTDFILPVPEQ
jgi:plastocyanin